MAENFDPIFPVGGPNDAYAQYFSGKSWLSLLTTEGVVTANVTFEPGCRNNWHVHHKGGQILLCTAGRGSRPGTACRGCGLHCAGGEALAWGGAHELVLAHRR